MNCGNILFFVLIFLLFPQNLGNCTVDCSGNGFCISDNVCQCFSGYITSKFGGNTSIFCDYRQKEQLTAFLLELFVEAGYFYVADKELSILQIFVCIGPFVLISLYLVRKYYNNATVIRAEYVQNINRVGLMWTISWFCFYLYSLVQFGQNNVRDGNGFMLKPW
jgi:hypothetical protein